MAFSSAPTAKANLLTLLQASSDLSGVQVSYGHPSPDKQSGEYVFFGRVRGTEESVALGNMKRDEHYTIDVIVGAWREGDDAQSCEERGWTLVAAVESVVHANPTLNGAVSQWAVISAMEQTLFQGNGARLSEHVVTLYLQHRKPTP